MRLPTTLLVVLVPLAPAAAGDPPPIDHGHAVETEAGSPGADGPEIDGPELDGPELDGPELDGPELDGPELDGPADDVDLGTLLGDDDLDLTDLSLEELMNIDVEVTSVSRKSESLARSAAAVYVITAEDIRRSGARSLPEALRLAPGLHVARLTNGDYAVSVRGFAQEFSSKMLVLIDGRTVYTPLFSGVFWAAQDLALEDVERIEVVRGPGGTLWGANAVNGVINIITRPAEDLEGGSVGVVTGTQDRLETTVRTGGPLGKTGWLRTYLKTRDQDSIAPPESTGIPGGLETTVGGFRADWGLSQGRALTLQGDGYRSDLLRSQEIFDPTSPIPLEQASERRFQGGNLLGRWSSTDQDGSTTRVQGYLEHTEIRTAIFEEQRQTFDLDVQRRTTLGDRHSLVYGVGVRVTHSDTVGSDTIAFDPASRTDELFSAFVQDEYQATAKLQLTAGTKVEHNVYTGLEVQPSLRFSLARGDDSTLWGAVSRAVRMPSQISDDLSLLQGVLPDTPAPGATTLVSLNGNEAFESEDLLAYELGYRTRPTPASSVDVSLFVYDYDDVETLEFGAPSQLGPATFLQPVEFRNNAVARSYGSELAGQWNVSDRWTLHASYSLLLLDVDTAPDVNALNVDEEEDQAPRNQVHLRSYYRLTEDLELDLALWYVDNVGPTVDSYVRGDLRLGWRPNERLRLGLGIQGLFHDGEPEFPAAEFGSYYGNETRAFLMATLTF